MEVQLKTKGQKPVYRKAFPVSNKEREFLKSQFIIKNSRIIVSNYDVNNFRVTSRASEDPLVKE